MFIKYILIIFIYIYFPSSSNHIVKSMPSQYSLGVILLFVAMATNEFSWESSAHPSICRPVLPNHRNPEKRYQSLLSIEWE